jgi:AcrR family transcriptional regulator
MTPRNYSMTRRAAAVEETRRRILEATRELHNAKGIGATRWEEIAARAGVGVGTVYRHFPTAHDLISACGRVVMDDVALPDPASAPARFAGATPRERIDRLVAAVFEIYERAAPDLRAVVREANVHPSVTRAAEALDASLRALIDAALAPLPGDRAVTRGLLDLRTWEALRAQELGHAHIRAVVSQLLAAIHGVA